MYYQQDLSYSHFFTIKYFTKQEFNFFFIRFFFDEIIICHKILKRIEI